MSVCFRLLVFVFVCCLLVYSCVLLSETCMLGGGDGEIHVVRACLLLLVCHCLCDLICLFGVSLFTCLFVCFFVCVCLLLTVSTKALEE